MSIENIKNIYLFSTENERYLGRDSCNLMNFHDEAKFDGNEFAY
jgi:hypothetical protein